ncbi:hypothetical protein K2173_008786 [Erythroxylum novogranatense]|uniref:BHLH domain-containing protein n=1 Tax=Erythroxylum novogranatense TaxID=1862640 RepID=A0AAV8SZX5_9ROSI|nr:hypothetical protein K2173_008786 [Erythroxylum novogranatense]
MQLKEQKVPSLVLGLNKKPESKMESDLQLPNHFFLDHHQQQHHQYEQKQMSSGLTRYQSAPSSYFSSFLDRDFCEELLNRPTSPETERIFARFLSDSGGNTYNPSNPNLFDIKQDSPMRESTIQVSQQEQTGGSESSIETTRLLQQNNYNSSSQNSYQNHSKPPLPDHNSKGTDQLPQTKIIGGSSSGLVRHSSSPAGLFSNINIEFENGYAVLRGMGEIGKGNEETSFSATSRPPAYSGRMSPISEIGNRDNTLDCNNNYVSCFPVGPWDDTATDNKTLSGLNQSETQTTEPTNRPPMLAHHLSLPKSTIEKFLQFQDSVPCKIRAKRGCATHPRSIAERVRRTKISERMRKLQDLVPNMDKQTNTSDMLDLAVDYIKDLQRQVKELSENRAKCTCTKKL